MYEQGNIDLFSIYTTTCNETAATSLANRRRLRGRYVSTLGNLCSRRRYYFSKAMLFFQAKRPSGAIVARLCSHDDWIV
jgi:hypothetical protein